MAHNVRVRVRVGVRVRVRVGHEGYLRYGVVGRQHAGLCDMGGGI